MGKFRRINIWKWLSQLKILSRLKIRFEKITVKELIGTENIAALIEHRVNADFRFHTTQKLNRKMFLKAHLINLNNHPQTYAN